MNIAEGDGAKGRETVGQHGKSAFTLAGRGDGRRRGYGRFVERAAVYVVHLSCVRTSAQSARLDKSGGRSALCYRGVYPRRVCVAGPRIFVFDENRVAVDRRLFGRLGDGLARARRGGEATVGV